MSIKINVALFFDGTGNNLDNIIAKTPEWGGSYASSETNIALLY